MKALMIHTTTDYELFIAAENNRDVNNTGILEMSMRTHGWDAAMPMVVTPAGNGKLQVFDGHHRLKVAIDLGIPVCYTMKQTKMTFAEHVRSQNVTSQRDTLDGYVRSGLTHYIKMDSVIKHHGISIDQAIQIMSEKGLAPRQARTEFFDGTFKYRNFDDTRVVTNTVTSAKLAGASWASDTMFVSCIMKIMRTEDFSLYRLNSNISKSKMLLRSKPRNQEEMLLLLEKIYNKGNYEAVPLAFIVEQMEKKKNKFKK